MINDCGAEYLGRSLQYKHPHHQILHSLNLNCNLIDDDGACALAKALRWNRNLTCLALAGNRIGDRGGIALARVFLPFQLTQEELEFRAELLCNRLLQVKTIANHQSTLGSLAILTT
uniref:Leucine-rich repeat-containing protein 71 n=1 Tax=Lygus hesperus TaxID=30085 RepID=A0A0A9XPV3_LYGHE